MNEVLHGIRRRTYVKRDRFNPGGKLCLKNGVLELRTLEVTPHTTNDRFVTQLPVEYDPKAECPRWLEFIDEVQPKAEIRRALKMAVGYTLSPRNEYQKAFFLYGPGNNGKSTFFGGLRALLGPENTVAETLQDLAGNRFAKAELYGKIANICADIPSNPIPYTGLFKMLTGEDLVTAERKYAHPFSFVWGGKLWFSANEFPQVNDKTYAFWRRWEGYEFPVNFAGKEDRGLLDKFRLELSGILNWALEGLADLREAGGFPQSAEVDALRETWQKHADPLFWFVSDCCEIGPKLSVPKDDFYQSYREFADDHSLPSKKPDRLAEDLMKLVPSVRTERPRGPDGRQVRTWAGIHVKPESVANSREAVSPDSPDSDERGQTTLESGESTETGGNNLLNNRGNA